MKNNFDLRKFLTENKLTSNSELIKELKDTSDGRDIGGKIIEFADGKNVDVHVAYHRGKTEEFYDIPVEKAIDITNKYIDQNEITSAATGAKDSILMIDDGDASIDIKKADGKKWFSKVTQEKSGVSEKKLKKAGYTSMPGMLAYKGSKEFEKAHFNGEITPAEYLKDVLSGMKELQHLDQESVVILKAIGRQDLIK